MPIDYIEGGGHTAPQDVHIFVRTTAPTVAQGVEVGDVWSDTTANLVKRCTSISPVTFTSIEGGGSGSMTTVKEDNIQVGGADIVILDFGTGFDLAESPDTEIQVSLDLGEIASGGELGGNMDAPTVDSTHSGSVHHAQTHDYDTHDGGVPFAEVEYDDATSNPLPADATAAADGVEGSAARKDHRHLGHAESHSLASHSSEAHSELTGVGATDHQDEVTLAGTPTYLTIAAQVITRALINLTSHVTGTLPIANGGTNLTALPDVEIPISAASLKGTTTAGAGDASQLPESAEAPTNNVNYDYMAFDTTTEENAFFQFSIPSGWDEGTITFRIKWTNAAGLTTETLVMGLKALALSNDEALDTAWGAEVTVTDTWLAQNDVHISPESAAVTIGGTPAEGDLILFNLARKTASDNLTGDARILEVILTFTRASYTD